MVDVRFTTRRASRDLLCLVASAILITWCPVALSETIALWLFDEQEGLYPSCVLSDASLNDFPLVLGRGGQLLPGRFGRALEPAPQADIELPRSNRYKGFERRPAVQYGRKMPPMDWSNAHFCALMTRGERHLRKEVSFAAPTKTRLNIGDFDWTIEFWFLPTDDTIEDGVVFEIGEGPRGENERVTRLLLDHTRTHFILWNQPAGTHLKIPSDAAALSTSSAAWHHLAFVYDAASRQLSHYVDGVRQSLPNRAPIQSLDSGDEDYFSIGRDGKWQRALPGRIDELRFSDTQLYSDEFAPPASFSPYYRGDAEPYSLKKGPPLAFAGNNVDAPVISLGTRKHVFIDDAFIHESENVTFNVNPPRLAERVFDGGQSHLTVDDSYGGLIRIYYRDQGRRLVVITSEDGINFHRPDLGPSSIGRRNVVIDEPVGVGTVILDPNAPPEERYKYVSCYEGRGVFVYSSPDGYHFSRNTTAALPFRAASQSVGYYDDQRQKYVFFHRTDMPETIGGHTERASVRTETTNLMQPWPFTPLTQTEQQQIGTQRRIGTTLPWYLDNGPLTPGGFGVEYPTGIAPEDRFDPVGTDIYVPKTIKYAYAPDTYLAFPLMYFHYHDEGPTTRQILGRPERKRGSGPLETQIAVSRDGIHWKRYPRPPYIKIGRHAGFDIHKNYIAHGLVRRGDEVWQYYFGSEQYHSSWRSEGREAVFRVVQRIDGFVSADAGYTGGRIVTKPFTFEGDRLHLNIDTGATGYAQVGFLNARGDAIPGYETSNCIYINGDHTDIAVEWLDKGADVSELEGQPVQLVFEMRGAKLYALQFVKR